MHNSYGCVEKTVCRERHTLNYVLKSGILSENILNQYSNREFSTEQKQFHFPQKNRLKQNMFHLRVP